MDIHSPIPPEARDSGMGVRHVPGRRLLRRWAPALVSLALLAGVGFVRAEKADRNKPMNIEADALRHDDLKQTSVFTGRVVMAHQARRKNSSRARAK